MAALEGIRGSLPFPLKAIDSDNGSEFINHHLKRYCETQRIQFTRSRPYKKNDNAHIEQKNWNHVRKIFGWDRFDTEQRSAMNALCRGDLRLYLKLYQPSVKLINKERIGSRVRRHYDTPKTPRDRLLERLGDKPLPLPLQRLLAQRANHDPFEMSQDIDTKLRALTRPRHLQNSLTPRGQPERTPPTPQPKKQTTKIKSTKRKPSARSANDLTGSLKAGKGVFGICDATAANLETIQLNLDI